MIITNPPFGGMEEDGIETNFPKALRTRETVDLFLVLIMHLLKDGGRAAIVLPDGTLFGEGVKTRIKENCWPNATCTPSSGCLTACSIPTPASKPTCCFSPKAGLPGKSGITNTPIRRALKITTKPNPCAFKSLNRKNAGG